MNTLKDLLANEPSGDQKSLHDRVPESGRRDRMKEHARFLREHEQEQARADQSPLVQWAKRALQKNSDKDAQRLLIPR